MKLPRRSVFAIVVPILLAAVGLGIVLTERAENAAPAIFPEDLTNAIRAEVAASLDGELERFYESTGFAPAWRDRREEAQAALLGATARGLESADYLRGVNQATDNAATDVALTKSLMRYAQDVRYGRWNTGVYGKLDAIPPSDLLGSIAKDPSGLEAGLRKLDPPFAEYKRLETALAQYRQRPTSEVEAAEQIRQIEQTKLEETMDRWRWLPRSFEHGAILVNIPEFRLRVVDENNNVALNMKVIVGLTKHPTPLFTAALKYLVFGPYWNVPASILRNELIPDIVKDRTYLERNAYEVVTAEARVVSTGVVSDEILAGLKSGELHVRQVPGPKNALGRVKFMFPNQNDVYLHDTPSRNLFSKERRDFSHGCVRVENPEALVAWVLRKEPVWTTERIQAALKQTKPLQANLKETIPVFMLYHTVTVGEDGEVHFWPDLYKLTTTAGPGQRPRE